MQKKQATSKPLERISTVTGLSVSQVACLTKTPGIVGQLSYVSYLKPDCASCPLSEYDRSSESLYFVPADLRRGKPMLIGEAPGQREVREGKGFVGDAGEILWKILAGLGYSRDHFSVTNILKCQPPKNDFALAGTKGVKACSPAFEGELKQARPSVLVAIGQRALTAIAPRPMSISLYRGQPFMSKYGIPAIATYHPAYFRRTNDERIYNAIWDDLSKLIPSGLKAEPEGLVRKEKPGVSAETKCGSAFERSKPQPGFKQTAITQVKFLLKHERNPIEVRDVILDIEGPFENEILCVGYSSLKGKMVYVTPGGPKVQCSRMIGHFARYDYTELRKRDLINEDVILEDTIALLQLLDENRESYGLKSFAQDYGFPIYWDAREEMERGILPEKEKLYLYNATDVELTKRIYISSRKKLVEDPKLERYYEKFLVPAVKLCAEVELNGAMVSPLARGAMRKIKERIYRQQKWIKDLALALNLETTNVNATLFKHALLKELKLESPKKTPKGKVSLDKHALLEMERGDKTGVVRHYRKYNALLQQQKDLAKLIPFAGKLVHAKFNLGGRGQKEYEQGSPVTGRTSSQDPNMQNFPDWVRAYFISRFEGGKILKADASQIELRAAYCYSRDEALLSSNRHQMTADLFSRILGGGQRNVGRKFTYAEGKTGNFALIFGAGVKKIEQEFQVTEEESHSLWHALRDEFPIHFEYVERVKRELRRTGEVRSLTGRIRRLPLATRGNPHALNQGVNYPIQSLANDITLMSALWLGPRGEKSKSKPWKWGRWALWNLVHDELVIDCESEKTASILAGDIGYYWGEELNEDFEGRFGIELPTQFSVKVSIGGNWFEMEEVG